MALSSDQLWGMYATKLADLATAGQFDKNSQVICFSGQNSMLDLANSDAGVVNYNLYQVASAIPAWSPTYAPKSDVVSSYGVFVDSIDLGGEENRSLDQEIADAIDSVTKAQKNSLAQFKEAITGWKDYKEAFPGTSFDDYVNTQFPVYRDAQRALTAAQSRLNQLMNQRYGPGFSVWQDAVNKISLDGGARDHVKQNRFNMLAKTGNIAATTDGKIFPGQERPAPSGDLQEVFVPSFTIDGFKDTYAGWQNNSVAHKFQTTMTVAGRDFVKDWSEFGWDASVNASWLGSFLSIFGNGSSSGRRVKDNWQDTSYSLTIKYTGFGVFNINPGPWYDPGLVQSFHDKLRPGTGPFFGPQGSLNLGPSRIILGMEPQIELKLDNQDYQSLKESWRAQASVSVGIGPFRLGSATVTTYGGKEDIKYHDDSHTVVIEPVRSGVPMLLGVICTKL